MIIILISMTMARTTTTKARTRMTTVMIMGEKIGTQRVRVRGDMGRWWAGVARPVVCGMMCSGTRSRVWYDVI